MANFTKILKTKSFPFICGPEKTHVHIHEAVVAGLSEPLHVLISSGMQDSLARQAVLEEVEPQTFILFAEYAHTGSYRVSDDTEMPEMERSPQKLPTQSHCQFCSNWWAWRAHWQLGICSTSRCVSRHHVARYCKGCGTERSAAPVAGFCSACVGNANSTDDQLGEFEILKRRVEGMPHIEEKENLAKLRPADQPTSEISRHAKLFVFANKYLIEGLTQLCLHKLERGLMVLDPKEENVSAVIELLEYTYDNTVTREENSGGVGIDLRELVMAYAASNANQLIKFETFREMLTKGTELVADFTVQALGASK